ncbi:ABC transporter substrate-binding protein [Bauldia sp.]|uniref:ABC transporter substrate-binding protein n=1 Tax=Bauldia sp. TaxID=2575872 RepID=UPI003BAA21CE
MRNVTGSRLARAARVSVLALSAVGIVGLGSAGAETKTLKIWALKNEGLPEFIAQAAEAFKEINPDVEVVFEDFPNEAYKTTIQVALVGSDAPDIFFNWSGDDAARLVRDNLALDISELGGRDGGFRNYLSDGWQASFMVDGKNFGIPTDAVSKYFYYNTNFFDEHGLTAPDDFEGLLQLCRDIRAIDPSIVPVPLGNSERWKLNHYITMFNQRVVGEEATAADYALTAPEDELFTNPKYIEAWQKVLDMQEAGCWQDAPNATSPEATRSMFSAEVSPMIYCGTWCASIFDSEGFTDYAMFRMPPVTGGDGDPNANFLVPQGYQIWANTENPEEAVAFASFLVNDEQSAKFAEARRAIPSNPALIDTVEGATPQFTWIVKDVGSFSGGINVLDVLLENSVSEAYLNAGVEILNGTKTPEEAMDQIRGVALEAKEKLGL